MTCDDRNNHLNLYRDKCQQITSACTLYYTPIDANPLFGQSKFLQKVHVFDNLSKALVPGE